MIPLTVGALEFGEPPTPAARMRRLMEKVSDGEV